jgi:hypothetical protein
MGSRQAKVMKKHAMKEVGEAMNERLDKIERFCQDELAKQDKRGKAIQSWLIQEVTGKIQNDLYNASCTLDAIIEVLAASGVVVDDFANKVDQQKIVVAQRKQAAAEAAMQAHLEEKNAKAAAEAAAVGVIETGTTV